MLSVNDSEADSNKSSMNTCLSYVRAFVDVGHLSSKSQLSILLFLEVSPLVRDKGDWQDLDHHEAGERGPSDGDKLSPGNVGSTIRQAGTV